MKREPKDKQIVVRFDSSSYDTISAHAKLEHRGLGESVRHASLVYVQLYNQEKESSYFSQLPQNHVKK